VSDWRTRLSELRLSLPAPPAARGNYRPVVVWNDIAYVSGQVCRTADDVIHGPADEATAPSIVARASQVCVLRALSALHAQVGLDSIAQILFLRGFVSALPGFKRHSAFLDPASDLLTSLFGERGQHARSAIGVSSLPDDGLLEVELVVGLSPDR
jgi:enamine deaminase RidA (YjgF/YER057c/UK114 family)